MESGREIFAYQVDTEAGERVAYSLLGTEIVFVHGLHPQAILGVARTGVDAGEMTPADLQENPTFLRFLSRVLHEHIDECSVLRREAEVQGAGYIYVLDGRTADPGGRVPPEDIIGAVQVEAGAMVPGSFQHNPRHRLLTHRGWFRLPDELDAVLLRRLREAAEAD